MKIIIKGEPHFQKRHRHGKGRTWNPSASDKASIAIQAKAQINETMFVSPVRMEITAYYPIPKSIPKKDLPFYEGIPKPTKPDVDNIAKIYCDALNGIAYLDDNLVAELTVRKLYSAIPCVVIDIDLYEV
jgi:Holliday junction resolvase RusA-like endonuclease